MLKWISYFSSILLFQDSLSLSFLQFMPCWEGTWHWFLSLYDMQLLPWDNLSGSQVLREKSGNKLSHMLWFFVHIKCDCPGSSMWPFYAFSLLPGLYFIPFLLWFLYWISVPIIINLKKYIYIGDWFLSVLDVIFHFLIHDLRHTLAVTMFAQFAANLWEIWR